MTVTTIEESAVATITLGKYHSREWRRRCLRDINMMFHPQVLQAPVEKLTKRSASVRRLRSTITKSYMMARLFNIEEAVDVDQEWQR